MRWVKRYKKDGNEDFHYRKPVAYKVKKEYVKFLLDELQKRGIAFNRYAIGDDLKSELKSEFFKLKLASFLFECDKLLFEASPPYKEIAIFFKSIMDVLGK